MLPKLTCYHCHQKTVDGTATGYACAACGQSWASLQDFIRARLAELSQSIESVSAQPTGPEPTRIAPSYAGAGNPRLGLICATVAWVVGWIMAGVIINNLAGLVVELWAWPVWIRSEKIAIKMPSPSRKEKLNDEALSN